MTRALSLSPSTEIGTETQPGDWQALRGELVALLDQVEGQYAKTANSDPAYAGFAQRMRDLRVQVADVDPDDRKREALKSVKRQIDRFNERGEPESIPTGDNVLQAAIQQIRARTQVVAPQADVAPAMAVSPPAQAPMVTIPVQAAPAPAPQPRAAVEAARPAPVPVQPAPRFDELAQAMAALTGRLAQFETELGAQRSSSGPIKEIADQVGQLSQVVELLAGAVGETGQVKRLEAQITGLGQMLAAGPKVDLTQLTERLDQVSATVDRLADLQVQQIQHVVREAEAAPQKGMEANRGLQAIEAGVRNIYDRFDTLESAVALPPAELERIGDMLTQISARLGAESARPDRLLGLVDALNGQINEIEDRGEALAGLKHDIGDLREAVLGAIEPRFAAIETKLGALDDRLESKPSDGPGIAQLEAQIRQLVARMDQTGEQLSSIAAMHAEAAGRPVPLPVDVDAVAQRAAAHAYATIAPHLAVPTPPPDYDGVAERAAAHAFATLAPHLPVPVPAPDFDDIAGRAATQAVAAVTRQDTPPALPDLNALADLVASRTSDAISGAVAAREPVTTPVPALSEANLGEIEARIARLVEGLIQARAPEAAVAVHEGIGRVEERLKRLEASLARAPVSDVVEIPASPPTPIVSALPMQSLPVPMSEPDPGAAPAMADPAVTNSAEPVVTRDDAMPRNPAAEAPLKEFGFPDLGPVRAALQARAGGPRRQPAATTDETVPPTPQAETAPPAATANSPARAPAFDATAVALPPRPVSSLETDAALDAPFASAPAPAPVAEPASAGSRNTFIEAARRAAQRQESARSQAGADSPIGRALARFQPGPAAGKPARAPVAPEPVPEMVAPKAQPAIQAEPAPKAEKPARGGMFSRREKPAPLPLPEIATVATVAPAPQLRAERRNVVAESALVRYRKPILVGASLIAVSFMALNLVMQRLSTGEGHHPAGTTAAGPAAAGPGPLENPPAAAPAMATAPSTAKPTSLLLPAGGPRISVAAAAAAAGPGPRIVPTADPINTASIGPNEVMNYASGTAADEPLPPALAAANSAAGAPSALLDSPVTVDPPPDAIGPLDLRQSAADGDARSQFEIAAIYSEGRAVPQDFKQAAIWYERAGAQGFAPAQYRLGNLYETGKGVDKDFEQARLWYQRAAEAGNRMAMHNLAALYAGGQFGKQDFGQAADWFQQAADRGMKDSQFNLGMLYARGLGVPQNLQASYKWFALAALTGDQDAAKARDNVARSLDAEAIKSAQADITAWKPTQIDLAANYAPIGTWQKDFNPGPAITAKDVVQKVQEALVRLGYDVGSPDGQIGPKTTLAIKAFERGTGMTEVGAINPRLLAVLSSQPV